MKLFRNLNSNTTGSALGYAAVLFAVCALFIFCGPTAVLADTTSTISGSATGTPAIVANSDICTPSASAFVAIQAIENDPTLSYLDEIKQELAVRRSLLSEVIVCAQDEAQALNANLESEVTDPAFDTMKNQLSEKLQSASSYYEIQLAKVNTAGISGTETIAKEVVAWREGTYMPLAAGVSNFILWSENQALFDAAQNRLAQVGNLAASVPFSQNSELQSDFQAANVSFESAENENAQAKTALGESASSNETLALIQQSLSDLSATYQHFFDISNLAEKLLPH